MSPNKIGKCEVCEKDEIPVELHYGNMWFCISCWKREQESTATHMSPESQQARVDSLILSQRNPIGDAVKTAQEVSSTIEVRTDLFNAGTVAILDIKKSIDENPEITNKPYALAEALKNEFIRQKDVIFELNQKVVEAGNYQRAIQTYLNTFANQLRAEEREKLRIQDINYRPSPVKTPTVKTITTRQTNKKTKIDKKELRDTAKALGCNEMTLYGIAFGRNVSVAEAAKIFQQSMATAKQIDAAKPKLVEVKTEKPIEEPADMDIIGQE